MARGLLEARLCINLHFLECSRCPWKEGLFTLCRQGAKSREVRQLPQITQLVTMEQDFEPRTICFRHTQCERRCLVGAYCEGCGVSLQGLNYRLSCL